jgi:hypothetical protein
MQNELMEKIKKTYEKEKIYLTICKNDEIIKTVEIYPFELLELIKDKKITKSKNYENKIVYMIDYEDKKIQLKDIELKDKKIYTTENTENFIKLQFNNYFYAYYKFNSDNTITFKLGTKEKTYTLREKTKYVSKTFKDFIKIVSIENYKKHLQDLFFTYDNIKVIRQALGIYKDFA